MATDDRHREQLLKAIELARAGQWDGAHAIVQRLEQDPTACWIHAVLHKIEGDAANARYWYREARVPPDLARPPDDELASIAASLG